MSQLSPFGAPSLPWLPGVLEGQGREGPAGTQGYRVPSTPGSVHPPGTHTTRVPTPYPTYLHRVPVPPYTEPSGAELAVGLTV